MKLGHGSHLHLLLSRITSEMLLVMHAIDPSFQSSKWQFSKKPKSHMQYAGRDIHTHAPAPRPNLRRKSVAAMPKPPSSVKRPRALSDNGLAALLNVTNERLARMEEKSDQRSK